MLEFLFIPLLEQSIGLFPIDISDMEGKIKVQHEGFCQDFEKEF